MKNKMLLTLLALGLAVPAFAYVSSSETYSTDFLKRNGYSDASIKMVNHERAKMAGVPIESERKVVKNPILRALYNAYLYVDPAADDGQFTEHDIKIEPSFYDL